MRRHVHVAEAMRPVQEQAARLRAAFDRGVIWTVQSRDDEEPVYEHAPVVPGLQPEYAFVVEEFLGRPCVVVEFGLEGGPPGLRWLHRFRPPQSGWQPDVLSGFQEGVECGWIGRSLARVPAGTSPVWTDFSWGHPSQRWTDALQLFVDGDLPLAAEVLAVNPPDAEARALAGRINDLLAQGDVLAAEPLRQSIQQTFHRHMQSPSHRTPADETHDQLG